MWIRTGMKFWHRLVAVAVLGLVSLTIYLNLPGEDSPDPQEHWQVKRLQGRAFRPAPKVPVIENAQMCKVTSGWQSPSANISTYDLYHSTQFNLRSDGEWELPPVSHMSGYEAEPDNPSKKLTVILLPHSHNDPGWLKTVTEYYTDQTKHILNNMVNKLTQYPNMTFVWAETVYFSMWWNELDDAVKVHVRRLIRRGQLEVALGGWVMPDEAATHYVAVVDQLVEGHQWLWENLRVRPQNSWSIDPFGHSGTMPYLWKKAGMNNMVTGRIHQAVKGNLMSKKSIEFNWRQMWDDTGKTDIFCHVLPFMLYSIKFSCGPNSAACLHFDFRRVEGDFSESLADDVTPENLEQLGQLLYEQYRQKAAYFNYNTILVPIGDDFRYDREVEWDQQYVNYERLIQYINSQKKWKIHLQWGTLKDYFQLVKQEFSNRKLANSNEHIPVVSGDFFPYSDKDSAYWTGYFTTRPFDKQFSRDLQSNLQAADIINTLCFAFYKKWGLNADQKFFQHSNFLQQARRSLGLFLHHDAITGTSKDFVARDYEEYLYTAYNQTQEVLKMGLQSLLSQGKVETPVVFRPETVRRTATDIPRKQVINVKESGNTVVFFNPLGQPRQQLVHILVDTQYIEVLSGSREVLEVQLSPVWEPNEDATVSSVAFEATFMIDLGPFAIEPVVVMKKRKIPKSLFMSSVSVYNTDHFNVAPDLKFHQNRPEPNRREPLLVDNGVIQLLINPETGSVVSVTDMATKNVTELNISFEYYKSQGSGAYLFKPRGPSLPIFNIIPVLRVTKGPLFTRVEIGHEPYLTHVITLYSHPNHLASSVFIQNTLNIQTLQDKELIMHMDTNVKNTDESYFTDQNGFQFIRRRSNPQLGVEANYYPMTSGAILEDQAKRLTLLSGQPHGVSSLDTGELEVMLDRQLFYDDNRGMGEGVTDIKTTISQFIINVEYRKQLLPSMTSSHFATLSIPSLLLNDILQQPIQIFYTSVSTDVFFHALKPFKYPLPCDTSAVSIRSLATGQMSYNGTSLILHRRGYDCSFPSISPLCYPSDPALSLGNLFQEFSFSNVRETSLTHTIVMKPVNPSEKLNIPPMELAAYHLHF